jgi:hypothetical protein
METIEKKLLDLLKTIEGNGSFETSGVKKITSPGLHIQGIGEIGFPLAPVQIREIIKVSTKAPFGKGSKTITDTTVRSAWEIDADQLSFHNEDWKEFMKAVINKVKEGLGLEAQSVTASLYKLLIYEEGDFFLPHKDSEKEPGMFGTLIIGLPSTHTGGELIIRFDGKEKIVDFSLPASNYKMPYVAFFADCEHEIKPITSGYRACLVYNLLQPSTSKVTGSPQISGHVDQVTAFLKSLSTSISTKPKAVLLDHQYTPANFSWSSLKHHDRPRAELLLEAAGKAGCFAELGLVTHYVMGELEGDFEYDYYDYRSRSRDKRSESSGGGTMGEVYEEYTTIEHWGIGEIPPLGKIDVGKDDLLTNFEMGKGDPIEEEEEGYTGNAGMSMEYWYHYGAVILWPKSKHLDLLLASAVPVRLKWLEYYSLHWDDPELHSAEQAKQVIAQFSKDELTARSYAPDDFSIVATILSKLSDENFILDKCKILLVAVFERIEVKSWAQLLQHYQPGIFTPVFEMAANRNDVYVVHHLLSILKELDSLSPSSLDTFLQHHIHHIPTYLSNIKLSQLNQTSLYVEDEKTPLKDTIIAILEKVLVFSKQKENDAGWIKSTVEIITAHLPRNYVNKVLAVVVLHKSGVLTKALHQICVADLTARTAVKPSPPSDWKRKVPSTKNDRDIWDLLSPFLNSTTDQVFEYRKGESYRKQMEAAINGATVDLKMETIQKGSPYTLKLTKTQAAYEQALKNWKEDRKLLENINMEDDRNAALHSE